MVLGRNYGNQPMQIGKIAQEERIPKKFLEQILLEMRNAGILYSKKGAGGGYSLNKAPEDIYLSQIMRLIDGPIALLPCVSLNFYRSCEACDRKRFKQHVLDVTYREKSVADILDLSVDEAIDFFEDQHKILQKLVPLQEVGLGYVKLGQSSSTLSGGEAQRIKLASFLIKGNNQKKTLFIFDEPTTGLHFHDIDKLLKAFNALIALGNTVLVIEHNLDMIKSADWVVDIGPEGGELGGHVVFTGTPEDLISCKESYTGTYLKRHLNVST